MKSKQPSPSSMEPRKRPRKFFVQFPRPASIEQSRLSLPVCMHEQEIVEAIHSHDVILITGATGTGKTTQVPQFLLEDGFGDDASVRHTGMVAVTQPRRVAAVACSKRVAFEIGQRVGEDVGYRIRHENKGGSKIVFVTDGVLLREVENDILLQSYSAIVIDEVHERSLNTDLLLSFLSRTVMLRREKGLPCLKLIIMSATLDVAGVFSGPSALFPDPPVIKVPSRQYPITTHFAKRTSEDYLGEAFRKTVKIHKRLPPGGVLVFLTGRQEVDQLCKILREELAEPIVIPDSDVKMGVSVQPFYALLSDKLQQQIFSPVLSTLRKVVVATNIAETSVTVPDISYVVDCGRVKEKLYDKKTHLSTYKVGWISKASAEQRAGRAGRTGPGHCYRLYSSAVYDQQFEEFREPEIVRTPAENVVLRLRAMGIRHVHKFPFPTPLNKEELKDAEKLLCDLGALYDTDAQRGVTLGVTKIGRQLAKLPLPPRLGRMLLAGGDVIRYAIRVAGVLTVGTVMDRSAADWQKRHVVFRNERSDLLAELSAVCAVEHAGGAKRDRAAMRQLCESYALHLKSICEALAVADQLEDLFGLRDGTMLKPMSKGQEEKLQRAVLCGFADRVAKRMTRDEAIARGIVPRRARKAFTICGIDRPAFLDGGSALGGSTEFVAYSDLVEVEIETRKKDVDDYEEEEERETKLVLRGATIVKEDWLPELATALCYFRRDASQTSVYDRKRDAVLHAARVSYGSARWPVGLARVPGDVLEAEAQCESSTVFARALLAGRVIDGVKIACSQPVLKGVVNELGDVRTREGLKRLVKNKGVPLRALGEEWQEGLQALALEDEEKGLELTRDHIDENEDEY